MLAGVAGTIILIFVLLPCRGDENDGKEGERRSEADEKEGDFRGEGRRRGVKVKDSYEGGKRKGWMSPSLHNLRQGWYSARGQGFSRKERFQLPFRRRERGLRERAAKGVLHFTE